MPRCQGAKVPGCAKLHIGTLAPWHPLAPLFAPALSREEPRFPVGSPPVSARSSSRGNHPMARDNEADRIGRTGTSHRPGRLRLADGLGHLGISAGLAIGNALQGSPHLPLKGRCLHVDGQVERRRRSAQVLQDGLHPVRPRLLIGADLGRRILASQVAAQRRFWVAQLEA